MSTPTPTAIFANNRLLAQSIGSDSAVFGPHCHPSRSTPGAAAPFCALQLREASPARYRRLAEIVERQSEQRGLLLTKGGSFGFRGHRFELIEPAPGKAIPSCASPWAGATAIAAAASRELLGELANHKSFEALDRAYGR